MNSTLQRFAVMVLLAASWLISCSGPAPDLESERGLRRAARDRLSQLDGTIRLNGLEQPVEVLRDRWGVAHVYAETVHDLFFAQGFVAAQDRLYQMEIWRRTGSGELAAVFGEEFVESDRIARLVRFRGDMDAEWASYSPDTKAIATAFTAGINAFVDHRGGNLPIEFELLGFRPGKWEPEDCLLRIAGLLMVRNLRQEIARTEMVARLGAEETRKWFPPEPARDLKPDRAIELAGLDERVLRGYRAVTSIPALAPQDGSNNWVVDKTLSATGGPLLASDPHRAITMPSLRYMIHLTGPGWNVIGAGEPALPGVAIGHNERIGWGFTIVQYDQADLFVEHVDPDDSSRYRDGEGWLTMQVEREVIEVRGRAEPVEAELKFTKRGPVIWEDPERPRVVSLRWIGQEPGTAGYLGSLALDRVQNWEEFLLAMRSWKVPAENMVYADVDGNIGWLAAGLLPVRENWSGLLPVPGFTGRYVWEGFRRVEDLPRLYNPPQHFIATANHNIRPRNYSYDLGFDWSPPYRFRRIEEALTGGGRFSVEDFQELQHDETSLPAWELTAIVAQLPTGGDTELAKARRLFEEWDHVLDEDSAAAALYEIWLPMLIRHFVAGRAPEEHTDLIARNLQLPVLIQLLASAPVTERERVLRGSLSEAWAKAGDLLGAGSPHWRWGTLHTVIFRHPLANTPQRRAVFNVGPFERGGDGFTPNATPGAGYRQRSGASYRHILDLSDWDRSVFTSAPGQSGQPESAFYADLAELWSERRYAPLAFSRRAVEADQTHRLELQSE